MVVGVELVHIRTSLPLVLWWLVLHTSGHPCHQCCGCWCCICMGHDIVVINVVVVGVALAYVRVSCFINVQVHDADVYARGFMQYQCRDG